MSKIVLEAKDIFKHFDDGKTKVEVIKGLSLQVNAGEFVSIVGSSGSGKSTLLNTILGYERSNTGKLDEKFSCKISNLYFDFPDLAIIEFCLLYSYPDVMLISSEILSFGLKLTNNLASLLELLGA